MTNTYIAPGDAEPEAIIGEVEKGFYAASFGGGQVDPATGDFVFGVSEGYLIEGGRVTRPCRGATLIGNCLQALAAIDAVGNDFAMKTGICGKGGQSAPVGHRPGPRPDRGDDRRGDRGLIEARRGAEPSRRRSRAGATDAEAYASEASEREVRAHGGEVESLTAATQRGLGLRAWIGGRVGYAYGTDLGEAGHRGARRPRRRGGRAPPTRTSSPAPRRRAPSAGRARAQRPLDRVLVDGRGRRAGAGGRARGARRRPAGRRRRAGGLRRLRRPGRDRLLDRDRRRVRVLELLRLREGRSPRARTATETGLGFDLARGPAALDPVAAGREGAERATAMIGAGKPESRSCPVVLDPTVAASFVGLIGGVLGADAVQRGRSPFAERLGAEVGAEALTLHDDGLDPGGPATAPFDGEGVAPRAAPP